jgi:putative transposase
VYRKAKPGRSGDNAESCLRLVRALTIERHEAWLEDHRYLNMDLLKEHKKEALRQAA